MEGYIFINRSHNGCMRNVRIFRAADAEFNHYLVYDKFSLRLLAK